MANFYGTEAGNGSVIGVTVDDEWWEIRGTLRSGSKRDDKDVGWSERFQNKGGESAEAVGVRMLLCVAGFELDYVARGEFGKDIGFGAA